MFLLITPRRRTLPSTCRIRTCGRESSVCASPGSRPSSGNSTVLAHDFAQATGATLQRRRPLASRSSNGFRTSSWSGLLVGALALTRPAALFGRPLYARSNRAVTPWRSPHLGFRVWFGLLLRSFRDEPRWCPRLAGRRLPGSSAAISAVTCSTFFTMTVLSVVQAAACRATCRRDRALAHRSCLPRRHAAFGARVVSARAAHALARCSRSCGRFCTARFRRGRHRERVRLARLKLVTEALARRDTASDGTSLSHVDAIVFSKRLGACTPSRPAGFVT